MHVSEQNDDNTNSDDASEHNPENTHNNTQTTQEEEKNESDKYVTIKDINITSEMNVSNRESENAEYGERENLDK